MKPKCKLGDLLGAADKKYIPSKGDTINWSYKFYRITEFIFETIPNYHTNKLSEKYDEAFSKNTQLIMEEKKDGSKKLIVRS